MNDKNSGAQPLRVLSAVHTYAPTPHSGADIYAERVNTWLADNGCEVKVIKDLQPSKIQYKNHTVESNQHRIAENYEWCDVVITNLVTNNQAALLAERFKKPIFHIVHNATMPTIEQKPNVYIIYNSHWLAKERPLNFPSIIVQPVTWAKDWKESFGNCITLVNGTPNKGPEQLHAIAQGMPWLNFIIVHGRYGNQFRKPLSNINYVAFTDDMQSIYDRTAILLVPSKLESWSLCAAEAQACGIPVICHDLPGLRENMGESGIYTKGTRGFMDCITGVLAQYDVYRSSALINANKKNHILQLENLLSFMKEKVINWHNQGENKPIAVVKEIIDTKEGFEVVAEKVQYENAKEKVIKQPVREKKIINKPATKQ